MIINQISSEATGKDCHCTSLQGLLSHKNVCLAYSDVNNL